MGYTDKLNRIKMKLAIPFQYFKKKIIKKMNKSCIKKYTFDFETGKFQ